MPVKKLISLTLLNSSLWLFHSAANHAYLIIGSYIDESHCMLNNVFLQQNFYERRITDNFAIC